MDTRARLWQGAGMSKRSLFLAAALALAVEGVRAQDEETASEILSDTYASEELGVNELTAPSIQRLFNELELFKPVPIKILA